MIPDFTRAYPRNVEVGSKVPQEHKRTIADFHDRSLRRLASIQVSQNSFVLGFVVGSQISLAQ
jgi:hypothetical protein